MQLCISLLQGQVSGCNCSFCSACRTLVHRITATTADVHVCCRHISTDHNQQGVIYTCGSLESSIPLRSASSAALFFASAASHFFLVCFLCPSLLCLLRTKQQGAGGGPAATAGVYVCCRHNSTEHNQQGVIYTYCSLESSIPLLSASSAALFFASAASHFFLSASSAFRFSASCGPRSRVQVEVRLQLRMCMCVVGTIPQNTISKE